MGYSDAQIVRLEVDVGRPIDKLGAGLPVAEERIKGNTQDD